MIGAAGSRRQDGVTVQEGLASLDDISAGGKPALRGGVEAAGGKGAPVALGVVRQPLKLSADHAVGDGDLRSGGHPVHLALPSASPARKGGKVRSRSPGSPFPASRDGHFLLPLSPLPRPAPDRARSIRQFYPSGHDAAAKRSCSPRPCRARCPQRAVRQWGQAASFAIQGRM